MSRKNTIRLTESEFKQIVAESVKSVKRIISELDVPKPRDSRGLRAAADEYFGEYEGDIPQDWVSDSGLLKYGNKVHLQEPKYDKRGFNVHSGLHKTTGTNRDEDGFNVLGLDRDGYDKDGYGLSGFDREGFDKKGYDREGYNKKGFNKKGYDREGYYRTGYNPSTGLDRQGLDKLGRKKGKKTWEDVIYDWVLDNVDKIKNTKIKVVDKTWVYDEFMQREGEIRSYTSLFAEGATKHVSKLMLYDMLSEVAPDLIPFTKEKKSLLMRLVSIMFNTIYDCCY